MANSHTDEHYKRVFRLWKTDERVEKKNFSGDNYTFLGGYHFLISSLVEKITMRLVEGFDTNTPDRWGFLKTLLDLMSVEGHLTIPECLV